VVYISIVARALLAVVFLVSAASKGATPKRFRVFADWVGALPLPWTSRSVPIAAGVVACEAAIVPLLIVPVTVRFGFALAAILLVAFIWSAVVILHRDHRTTCMCFGKSTSAMGWRHVVRDLILLFAALVGIPSSTDPLPAPAGLGVAILGAVALAVVVITWDDIAYLLSGSEVST
jgi:hypothetical protein